MTAQKHLVFDIEANALELNTVSTIFCIAAIDVHTDTTYYFGPDDIHAGKQLLQSATRLIGHNIIWYDLPVLQKLVKFDNSGIEIIDTLILSRKLNPDRYRPFGYAGKAGPHSIEVWGARLGHKPKLQIEDFSKYTEEIGQRCREDVIVNLEVYKELYRECNK